MKVRRSRLEVLSILDHVDLWGADATTEKFGVDGRTLKRWAEREPSGWQREEEVNRLLMIEKRAAGKVSYRDAVVGLGIASDKLWRLADRAARALRREEAEPEQPSLTAIPSETQQQIDRLDESRRMLWTCEIDYDLEDRADRAFEPDEPGVKPALDGPNALAWVTAEVDRLLALTDDEVEEQKAAWFAIGEEEQAKYERDRVARLRPPELEPAAVEPADTPEQAPTPIRRATARPEPVPVVLDVGSSVDHDRGWHPWD